MIYDFYKAKLTDKQLKKSRQGLKKLYSKIPETKGCQENIAKEGGCGAWCCEKQTPQVMYSEFLNTWNYVLNTYPADKVAGLLLKAVRLYLDAKPTKGCIFWDKKTKLCSQHETRPMNCRVYAQIPEEEFKPRFERLKVLYDKIPGAFVKEQCNLCTTQGTKPTKEDTDAWQKELEEIEEGIVGDKKLITDNAGGSYRAYHDHILLRLASPTFLAELTQVRLNGSKAEREEYVRSLHRKLKAQHPALEDTVDEDAGSSIIIAGADALDAKNPGISKPTGTGDNPGGIILP
jgi:Fe-S-cluster containining protein